MSVFTTAEKNAMLNATTITHVAAFNGEPGAGGTEVGSDRGAITWAAASNGQKSPSAVPEINVPGGASVSWLGYYDAAAAGTLRGKDALAATETFGSAGKLRVTTLTLRLPDPA